MAHLSAANYTNVVNGSIAQNIAKNPTALVGIFVSSATGATVAVFDDSATGSGTTIVAAFTPNTTICWYPMPFQTRNGIAVSITGTCSYTVAFD